MSQNAFHQGNLVLYKIRPAVVTDIGEKITIQFSDNKAKRVRDKDISLIHPGPVKKLSDLENYVEPAVSLQESWELLQGEEFSLADLAELMYDQFSVSTAWAAWQEVSEGIYFAGNPGRIFTRTEKQVQDDLEAIKTREREEQERKLFFEHINNATLDDSDRKKLSEVEMVALGKSDKSNILRSLDIKQSKESAHHFLLNCGYWDTDFNPYPARSDIDTEQPEFAVPLLDQEERLDLTGLDAYAIDDAESNDPDDAISLDGDIFWVHVADVAALVKHNDEIDLEARRRASNLYLPEKLVLMLPEPITQSLGLGLQRLSPALSIGFSVNESAQISDIRIVPSLIKAQRISYADADEQIETRFAKIKRICDQFRQRRLENNAVEIDLPEASVRVTDNQVLIHRMQKLGSRQMVTDAMLMAGHAVARFCNENGIPVPYAMQPQPESIRSPSSTSEMYAYRRLFKPSSTSLQPEKHFGLGLDLYTRATSPLRRYLDLVVHQQLRAFLTAEPLLTAEQLAEKIMAVDQRSATVRRTERLSNLHWKLVFLRRNPDWRGEAVIVEIDERKSTIIIPELAMEAKIRTRENFKLDDTIRVQVKRVELPEQTAYFQYLN